MEAAPVRRSGPAVLDRRYMRGIPNVASPFEQVEDRRPVA